MQPVNMLEAKSSLSRLVPLADAPVGRRIGVARGRFVVPDDIDVHNAEVASLLMGGAAR